MLPHICFVAGKTTNKGIEMDQRFGAGVAPMPWPSCLEPLGWEGTVREQQQLLFTWDCLSSVTQQGALGKHHPSHCHLLEGRILGSSGWVGVYHPSPEGWQNSSQTGAFCQQWVWVWLLLQWEEPFPVDLIFLGYLFQLKTWGKMIFVKAQCGNSVQYLC